MARVPGWWPLSGRMALAALALFWTVGAVLLVISWRSAVEQDRMRQAPVCVGREWLTVADCQVTLAGTMIALTSSRAEMNLGGLPVSADVTVSGAIPEVRGEAVRVTIYQGKVIHISGSGLRIDTDDSPTARRADFLTGGILCVVGGGLLVGINVLIGRRRSLPG